MNHIVRGQDKRGVWWKLYEHRGQYLFSDDTYTLAIVEGDIDPNTFDPSTFAGDFIETTEADLNELGLSKSDA